MTDQQQAALSALEQARAVRDGMPHGPERRALNVALDLTDVAISAARAAAPAGWVLVPEEPTPEMVAAMASAWQMAVERDDPNECIAEWRAALAAAPQPAT